MSSPHPVEFLEGSAARAAGDISRKGLRHELEFWTGMRGWRRNWAESGPRA
jgi:hypothetical protein